MESTKCIGVDVSKDTLDIALYEGNGYEMYKITNEEREIKRFFKPFTKSDPVHVAMEATGIYHKKLLIVLLNLKIKTSVINPLKIKRFSEMKMLRAKTDPVDARLISLYCFEQHPEPYIMPSAEQEEIFALIKAVDDYQKTNTAFQNRLTALYDSGIKNNVIIKNLKKTIDFNNKVIADFEKQIEDLIQKYYPSEFEKLTEIPGVGKKVASTILGCFGRFEHFESAKQAACFIGINPNPRQSGKSVRMGSNISKKGNSYVRKILYMGALSAKKYNKDCEIMYQRFLNNGTRPLEAQVAVAHKLIRQMFAIIKFDRRYQPEYYKNRLT